MEEGKEKDYMRKVFTQYSLKQLKEILDNIKVSISDPTTGYKIANQFFEEAYIVITSKDFPDTGDQAILMIFIILVSMFCDARLFHYVKEHTEPWRFRCLQNSYPLLDQAMRGVGNQPGQMPDLVALTQQIILDYLVSPDPYGEIRMEERVLPLPKPMKIQKKLTLEIPTHQ